MAKNLMESIAEDEASLAETTETDITEGDDDGIELERTEGDQPTDGHSSTTKTQSGDEGTEGNGRRGRRNGKPNGTSGRSSGKSPQGESGAPREDGETPPRDSGGTRKDASTSPEGTSAGGRDERRSGVLDDEDTPASGDHAAWAKLRREKRELEARLKAAEGKQSNTVPAAPAAQPKTDVKPATDAEPDKAANPEAWRDWKDKQLETKYADIEKRLEADARQKEEVKVYGEAIGEFNQIRDKYIVKNPDYVPAFHYSFDAYAKAIKMSNPGMTQQQITNHIDREMLQFAGQCVSKGLNPAEELYDMAIERFGYAPNSSKGAEDGDAEVEEEAAPANKAPDGIRPKEALRPNLRNIANNRKRAASPLVGGGQSGKGQLTKEAAANMTLGEMMELEPGDWAELERHGG